MPVWPYGDRRWLYMERGFALFAFGLLVYSVLAWQGVVGDHPFQPFRMVLLGSAIFLQSVGQLIFRRSSPGAFVVLALSIVLIGYSVVVHR